LEFKDLQDMGFDLELTGFGMGDIDELLAELDATPEGKTNADETPAVQAEVISKAGDVWVMGKHRVMCGDSTSIDAVDALMDGAKADMVFTDPPYGVEYQSNMRTKSEKFDVLANDHQFLDIAPVVEAFSNGWVFVWTSWKVQTKWIDLLSGFGYPTNIVIWHKPGGGIGDLKRGSSSIMRATRPAFSQPINVDPDPPKMSSTTAPLRVVLSIASSDRATGFCVGCSPASRLGFEICTTLFGNRSSEVLVSPSHFLPPSSPFVRPIATWILCGLALLIFCGL